MRPYRCLPTSRALAPRFARTSLFYLSSSLPARGTGDGLWRVQDGQASEVGNAPKEGLSEPPAVSPDGSRVAIVVGREGKRHLVVISADGRNSRTLAPSLDIQGAAGQGTADWSPDGAWIVTGGRDAEGPGLFKIPVDSGDPVRLVRGQAVNPVWSPDGKLIVYAGKFFTGQVELARCTTGWHAVSSCRPCGPARAAIASCPTERAWSTCRSFHRWISGCSTSPRKPPTTHAPQQPGRLGTFDVTPDGKAIVFDRLRENSNIVLIELPIQ